MTVEQNLARLGIVLPSMVVPAASYVMAQTLNDTIFLSGHLAKQNGEIWRGKLGDQITTLQGAHAARNIAIDLIATLKHYVGDLNRVRLVKVMSLVNSTQDFTEHHLVTNGCSELLLDVFGENGQHARSAFGVAQIPLGACVEIELIAQILA